MNTWTEDHIYQDERLTLDGLFRERVRRTPDRPAYRSYDRDGKTWRDSTWSEVARRVARWQAALASEDLEPGDRVALQLRNGEDWVVFEQAALGLGLVVVPLYTDDRPDNIAFILRDAAVRLLLVQDASRWKRLAGAVREETGVQRILVLHHPEAEYEDERVVNVDDWLPAGEHALRESRNPPGELATIVYTSGTTGRPKGVMLSHANILFVAHAALTMVEVYREDVFLSFLPLSHTLERSAGYYLPMMAGATVAHARSINQLADDLATVRPTVLIAVPRIFERIHARIAQQMEKGSPLKRLLFNATVNTGWKRFEWQQGQRRLPPGVLRWPLLRRLVADKVLARLGGRMRMVVSGGAPLPPEVARVFIGLGLPLLQGYGLTETSPVISVNLPEDNVPASVGVPLRGIEVRIGDDSELLVRSPGVMLGYWNNHAATDAMIDKDGWLHTGDQARIDERGHIHITGRIKDILVMSNGEKVPPGDMEMAIGLDPLFEQVMVIGEGRSHLTALVVLSGEVWPGVAQHLGIDPLDVQAFHDRKVQHTLLGRIARQLHDFPSWAKIRKAHFTLEPWTIDNGLLTPTLKIKRNKVIEHYREVIERLYE